MSTKKRRSMITYFLGLCLLIAIVLSYYVFFAPKLPDMQEGVWKISVEIEMPGTLNRTFATNSQRMTKAEHIPVFSIPGYECRIQRHKYPSHVLGNHVFWKIQCDGVDTIFGTGHIKFSGDRFKGKIQFSTAGDEDGQKRFNGYISGLRTGTIDR